MKLLKFLLLLTLSHCQLFPIPAFADPLDLRRTDHQAHALASYAIALSVADILDAQNNSMAPAVGFAAAFGAGLLKELTDPEFSRGDLSADFLGALTGSIFFCTVRW